MKAERAVIVGQLVGQGVLVAITPILTRVVDPAEVGIFQLGMAVALIAQPLATLRLEFVIPSTRGKRTARSRALIATGVTTVMGVALGLVALGLSLTSAGPAEVVGCTALVLLTYGWMAIDNALLVRSHQLWRLSIRNALSGLLAAAAQILLALVLPTGLALAIGLFSGRLVALVVTATRKGEAHEEGDEDRYGASRAVSAITSGVLANASVHVPVLFSGAVYGSSAAGFVGLAQRVAGAPTTLLGQSLGQVVTARTAPYIRADKPGLRRSLDPLLLRIGVLAAVAALAMAVLGPILAGPVFGDEWAGAGVYLAIFAVPLCLQVVMLPLAPVFVMLRRERPLLILQSARLALMLVAAAGTSMLTGDLFWTCVAMAAAWTLSYLAYGALLLRYASRFDLEARRKDHT